MCGVCVCVCACCYLFDMLHTCVFIRFDALCTCTGLFVFAFSGTHAVYTCVVCFGMRVLCFSSFKVINTCGVCARRMVYVLICVLFRFMCCTQLTRYIYSVCVCLSIRVCVLQTSSRVRGVGALSAYLL